LALIAKKIAFVLLLVAVSQQLKGQATGLILYNASWGTDGAFHCVIDVADVDFDYCAVPGGVNTTLSINPCFQLNYDVILVNATYLDVDSSMAQLMVDYILAGGNLYFQHNCTSLPSSIPNIDSTMALLLTAIGQESVTVTCNNIDAIGSAAEITSNYEIFCPEVYGNIDYQDGGILVGPGLADSYAVSNVLGVFAAFWHTGYGGILGIGSEYYSSGNVGFGANLDCLTDSGSIIWGFMDPEDPSCLGCDEYPSGCDDGDCMNGIEYWDQDSCDCVTIVIDDPGCDDGDCRNGLEFWNGCACETILSVNGCTVVSAENYNPDADCEDGTCIFNNYIYIPNIFSPTDPNTQNSHFQIQGNNVREIQWSIYDRWGNLVFEGRDLNDTWDGFFNGQLVAQGVYIYLGTLSFLNGQEQDFKGSITFVE